MAPNLINLDLNGNIAVVGRQQTDRVLFQKSDQRQIITPALKQLILDSVQALPDPQKVLVRDESRFMGEGHGTWAERSARQKIVRTTGFQADTKQPYRPLGEPELDVRQLVIKTMNIQGFSHAQQSHFQQQLAGSRKDGKRFNNSATDSQQQQRKQSIAVAASQRTSSAPSDTSSSTGGSNSGSENGSNSKSNRSNGGHSVAISGIDSRESNGIAITEQPRYRQSGYKTIKSHVQESHERMRAVKIGSIFEEVNFALQRKYERKCVADKVFDESLFDTEVEVNFSEDGWANRLAFHQKLMSKPGEFRIGPEVLPSLGNYRMDHRRTAPLSTSASTATDQQNYQTSQGQQSNQQQTQQNSSSSDKKSDPSQSSHTQEDPEEKEVPRIRNLNASRLGRSDFFLTTAPAWTPWPHFARKINNKAKEFGRIHDNMANTLSDNLEKMSMRRGESFKETWKIIGDLTNDGSGGDVALKLENVIHQRRDAHNRELAEWAREWQAMRSRFNDDQGDQSAEIEKSIWKQMKKWLEEGISYGEYEFTEIMRMIPAAEWSRNSSQSFLRFLKDKAFKLPERVYLELTVKHTKELTQKNNTQKSEEKNGAATNGASNGLPNIFE